VEKAGVAAAFKNNLTVPLHEVSHHSVADPDPERIRIHMRCWIQIRKGSVFIHLRCYIRIQSQVGNNL
jgi:hypothetical protein